MSSAVDPLPCFGTGVALRRLSGSDLAAFQAYRNDAELGRFQGWEIMLPVEARHFLEEMNTVALFRAGQWVQVGIAEPDSMALIGDIGLYLADDSRHAEIGFTLARHAQGRGLATAAVREALRLVFQLTAVECVFGITDSRNHASIRVLERVGMHKQQERSAFFRQETCVEYVYALVRDEG